MPGSSSNPALTADLSCNLRDRHPEIFVKPQPEPVRIPNRVAYTPAPGPELAPVERRHGWSALAAGLFAGVAALLAPSRH